MYNLFRKCNLKRKFITSCHLVAIGEGEGIDRSLRIYAVCIYRWLASWLDEIFHPPLRLACVTGAIVAECCFGACAASIPFTLSPPPPLSIPPSLSLRTLETLRGCFAAELRRFRSALDSRWLLGGVFSTERNNRSPCRALCNTLCFFLPIN